MGFCSVCVYGSIATINQFSPSCTMFIIAPGLGASGKAQLVEWVRQERPASTSKTYATYAKQYIGFAETAGRDPSAAVTLGLFLQDAVLRRGLSRSTVKDIMPSAIEDHFKYCRTSPGRDTENAKLLKDVKATVKILTKPSVQRKPLSVAQLKEMVAVCDNSLLQIRDVLMLILMFTGFLRQSEAVRLQWDDVWIDELEGKKVLFMVVRKSKMDQAGETATIVVGACPLSPLCPVLWYRAYASVAEKNHLLFYSMTNGKPLSLNTPAHTLKRWLTRIGVNPAGYASHSCRRGGATAAARAKAVIHVIKAHGRWASDCVYTYIEDDFGELASLTSAILG